MPVHFFPTVILPLSSSGQINYKALARLATYWFQAGAGGLFLDWQNDELASLSPKQKLELVDFCLDCCRAAGRQCLVQAADNAGLTEDLARLRPDALFFTASQVKTKGSSLRELAQNISLGLFSSQQEPLTPAGLDQLAAAGLFSLLLADYSQPDGAGLLDACLKYGLAFYNSDAATLLESQLAGAAGYCGSLFAFIPQIFSVLQRYLQGQGPALPYDLRRAEEFAHFIAMAAPFAAGAYPARLKYLLSQQGLLDSSSCPAQELPEAEKKQLAALASQAILQRSRADLFAGRQLAFPAERHFPSCHAATILPLPGGTILLAYFAGRAEGSPDVAIWLSRFYQGRWQEPVRIAKVRQAAHWNPVLFLDQTTVRLIFKVGPDITSWESWSSSSDDEGLTWTNPLPLATPDQALGPVRSKPVLLSNGLLLAGNSQETQTSWLPQVDVSADGGKSFACLARIPLNTKDPAKADYLAGKGAIQPVLWESDPGQIHLLLRTTAGWIFRSDSQDYGQTWCQAYKTGLPGNNSGIELVQQAASLYLIFNPVQGNWAARNPLVIWRSTDNGHTFFHYLTLENCSVNPLDQKDAEYAYPAALAWKGKLYLAYTYNRRQMACCIIDLEE